MACTENDRQNPLDDAAIASDRVNSIFGDELIDLLILLLLFGFGTPAADETDNNGSAPVVIDEYKNTNKPQTERGEN